MGNIRVYKKKSSYLSDEEISPTFILNDQDFDFFKRTLVACDEKEVIKKYKIY